jgi:hypothetical protein
MKKPEPIEQAKEIIDDYYNLMNQTYGARYSTAKTYAMAMLDQRLSTPNLHPDELQHWFEVKQAMQAL